MEGSYKPNAPSIACQSNYLYAHDILQILTRSSSFVSKYGSSCLSFGLADLLPGCLKVLQR